MFAMLQIPMGVTVVAIAIAGCVATLPLLIGAALGAVGAGSSGLRWRAIGGGVGVGFFTMLILGGLLCAANAAPAALSAPLVGVGLSFAVSRAMVRAEVAPKDGGA